MVTWPGAICRHLHVSTLRGGLVCTGIYDQTNVRKITLEVSRVPLHMCSILDMIPAYN